MFWSAMMVKIVKQYWWALLALVAALLAVGRGRNPWKDRAEKAAEAATQAHHDVIDAEAELELERADHEAENDHRDLNDMSRADLFRDALERVRARVSGR